ncbi:MAG TPA: glycosyltransferase family 1 protein [Syntrophorhabdaceae bacterium]|nr:glycosyltransferase family 1 protein [Syntrophorhabdaceae bacterium]
MKILINCIPLLKRLTGVGVYTFELAKELLHLKDKQDVYLFYYGYLSRKLFCMSDRKGSDVIQITKKVIKNIPCGRRVIKKILNFFKLRDVDLYFEPNFIPDIKLKTKATVTTVHDFSFTKREWTPKDRYEFFNQNFISHIYQSSVIITPSEYIKKELLNTIAFSEDRVVAIHHGIDHNVFNTNHANNNEKGIVVETIKKYGHYILYVGAIQPRKNIKGLIKAYSILPQSFQKELPLFIVGYEGWNNKVVDEMIKKNKNILILDSVSNNNELAELYKNASVFVFPSFYEGFGFPPLEAMACGCPVVVSNTSSLPEVCGDAAYYVDPHNTESIAKGIISVVEDTDLRKNMIQKGLERVKLFTWKKSAHKHQEVFKKALES